MVLPENKQKTDKNRSYLESFQFAFEGIRFAFKQERNLRFHFFTLIIISLAGWFFSISRMEWLVLILTFALVILMEMANTIAEWTIDLITKHQYHIIAKYVKDVAAGAVLIATIFAVIIGAIIFIPKILEWL